MHEHEEALTCVLDLYITIELDVIVFGLDGKDCEWRKQQMI
jgi:hypothetical protein